MCAIDEPQLKVKWANEKIEEIEARLRTVFAESPYSLFCDIDANSGERMLKIKLSDPFPDDVCRRTAEAIYHLRSALDLLAVACARKNGHTNTNGVYFPFAGDANEFKLPTTQRKIKKLSDADRAKIISLQPYKGGNDVLWALNRLSSVDKHIELIPVGSVARNTLVRNATFIIDDGYLVIGAASADERLEDGITIISVGRAGTIEWRADTNVHIASSVVFGNVEFFDGKAVVPTLHQLAQLVDGIIKAIV